jgi:urea ABC transporter ATP-binding protein UrtD
MAKILEIEKLVKQFGGLVVTDHVTFNLEEGELRCLIGPNGAGKTTLFNLITGHLKADKGRILFSGRDITNLPVHLIARLGVSRKFQSPTVFNELSVLDNVHVSLQGCVTPLSLFLKRNDPPYQEEAEQLLHVVNLDNKKKWPASKLSHGERQWLELAMVMGTKPRLLLLDEPTAGMTPAETRETANLLKRIAADISTIVIEHDLKFVREIAKVITVLHRGAILIEGDIDEIARNEKVRSIYLGKEKL